MSSKLTDTRITPPELLGRIDRALYGFHDVCPVNGTQGLEPDEWRYPSIYCNPPGSLKKAFARLWVEYRDARECGCWMEFNWDHSTDSFNYIEAASSAVVLLWNRWKFEGPDAKTGEWRPHEVGRSQALFFDRVHIDDVEREFEDIGYVWEL